MLTPREDAFADAATSAGIGLPNKPHGLLLCTDEHGQHATTVTADVTYARMLAASPPCAIVGLDIPSGKFGMSRPGWPDEW